MGLIIVRWCFIGGMALAVLCAGPSAWAGEGGSAKPPSNTIKAKVPANFVPLPRLRLAVPLDNNRIYRMLELEVWLVMDKPEDAAKLGSEKTKIVATMKQVFMGYRWEAFLEPETGFALAKALVKASVDQCIKGGPLVEDVLIRQMILR
ncbi:MAG TPA: hypothetical protein VK558_06230 [Patescibacteria group bacterium]|nr:hypothetical protein [Patescibacteria group bacterium]